MWEFTLPSIQDVLPHRTFVPPEAIRLGSPGRESNGWRDVSSHLPVTTTHKNWKQSDAGLRFQAFLQTLMDSRSEGNLVQLEPSSEAGIAARKSEQAPEDVVASQGFLWVRSSPSVDRHWLHRLCATVGVPGTVPWQNGIWMVMTYNQPQDFQGIGSKLEMKPTGRV